MDMLTMHPEAGFCSTMSLMVDEAGRKLGLFPSPIPSFRPVFINANRARRVLCRYGAWFLGNTTVFRRQALLSAGGFRSELLSFTDGFISHVLALKHGACFIPDPLGAWRQMEGGESGLTTRDDDRATEVIAKAVELMTTSSEYSHLFPRQYVRNWLTRRLYWAGDAALSDLGKNHARLSQTLEGRHVRPNLIDRILNTLIRGVLKIGLVISRGGLHFRCFTWPSTPLMIKWYVRSIRYTRDIRRSAGTRSSF